MQNATPNPAENTRYGYKNDEGHRLGIIADKNAADHVMVGIRLIGNFASEDISIPNAEAPAIALAILTAAGFEPSGSNEPSGLRESVETAAGYLDDAVHLAAGAATAKELTKRRDELAAKLFDLPVYELHPGPFTYFDSTEVVRNAIDMIIQLQDETTK